MAIATELNINTTATALDMANAIFGDGITIVSASFQGDALQSGTYTGALSTIPGIVPTDSGVILSTGNVADFTNSSGTTDTNVAAGVTTDTLGGINGDAQLNAVSGTATFDGAILDASFIPTGDMLTMQFVFSSEEYPEFVNGGVNDAFGVWINGTFVPATISVTGNISIDSVNTGVNQNLYRDNTLDQYNTEMDGFTYVLSFKAPVNIGQVNTIKIGIADGGDAALDSNLLIMGNSIQTYALANDDSIQLTANSSRTFDILANDRDETGAGLTITHLNGISVIPGQTIMLATGEQVRLNADGTVTVFSDSDLGTNTLSYTVVDGGGNTDTGYIFVETVSFITLDGIVSGTSGNDVIQVGYLGDPDGDLIDNNDGQGVGGTVGDADYVMAGGGNDIVEASLGNDIIYAGTGDDTVYGGDGDDWSSLGDGNDSFFGGFGNDVVYAGVGNDNLLGEAGNDTIFGDGGNDFIRGGAGADSLWGDDGDDAFYLGDNTGGQVDTIAGGEFGETTGDRLDAILITTGVNVTFTGDESGTASFTGGSATFSEIENVYGGVGNDTVNASLSTTSHIIDTAGGNDSIMGGSGNESIYGGADNDTINAGAGNDLVYGGTGADIVFAGDDADVIYGGANDTVVGGEGGTDNDTLILSGVDHITFGGGNNEAGTVTFADGSTMAFSEIENVLVTGAVDGTGGNDTMGVGFVDVQGDIVDGLDGINDTIFGYAGNDSINAGTGNDLVYGGADNDTVYGDIGNDTIYGETGSDSIIAGDGADSVSGGDGNDTVDGGVGNDILSGEAGNDLFFGGSGDDLVSGDIGNDSLWGDAGNDSLYGGDGNDQIGSGAGNDSLFGGADRDSLRVSEGDGVDTLDGGETGIDSDGFDLAANTSGVTVTFTGDEAGTYTFNSGTASGTFTGIEGGSTSSSNDLIDASVSNSSGLDFNVGAGNDTVLGSSGSDSVYGGTGNDSVSGAAGNDLVYGGDGSDILAGGTGNDTLYGEFGNDTLVVGDAAGNDLLVGGEDVSGLDIDRVDASSMTTGATLTFTGAEAGNLNSAGNIGSFSQIEQFQLGSGNDTVLGGIGNDSVDGGAGNDSMSGGAGNDTFAGGLGADTISTGDDADVIYGGANDVVTGGEGGNDNDTLILSGVDHITYGGGNNEAGTVTFTDGSTMTFSEIENIQIPGAVDGTSGNDLMYGGYADAQGDQIDGADGVNDTIFGNGGNDWISAYDGNDLIYGGSGNDTLLGYTGDDTTYGGDGNDAMGNGDGNDLIFGDSGDDSVQVNGNGNDTYVGGETGETIGDLFIGYSYGAVDSSLIFTGAETGVYTAPGAVGGGASVNFSEFERFLLGAGNDTVMGGVGNESVDGGAGNDSMIGGAGNDTFAGGLGADTLIGGADNDMLSGGDGNDTLDGGADNDTLYGDTGNDTLTGGDGADTVYGGDDRDSIFGGSGDVVDGGEGGDDYDVLDLTAYGFDATNIVYPDPMNTENGYVEFLDVNGNVTSTMNFSNIEKVIACFTPGSMILTDQGEVAVQDLVEGDRVLTRDVGFQTIRWIGRRDLSAADLVAEPRFLPVKIAKGALGANLPERDMMVSPQHRMLVTGPRAELLFGEHEVLIAATHMVGCEGISRVQPAAVSYIHLLFDEHQVVRADGAWSESFQPGVQTLGGLEEAQREEILALFPSLASGNSFPSARLTLKAKEARILLRA